MIAPSHQGSDSGEGEDTGGKEVVCIHSQMSPPTQHCIRVSVTNSTRLTRRAASRTLIGLCRHK